MPEDCWQKAGVPEDPDFTVDAMIGKDEMRIGSLNSKLMFDICRR